MDGVLVKGTYGTPFDGRTWDEGGREIWQALRLGGEVTLLSKVPDARLAEGYAQKRRWVDREIGRGVPLIVVADTWGKSGFCIPGDILVDDDENNCLEWSKAGGIAVHHQRLPATLEMLGRLLA